MIFDNSSGTGDGVYTYLFDAEGNRTAKFVDVDASGTLNSGDTDITAYAWDYRNRLTTVSHFDDQADYAGEEPDQVVEYAYFNESSFSVANRVTIFMGVVLPFMASRAGATAGLPSSAGYWIISAFDR